jgi:DNA-binding beta-propeller fold protein YncE
VTGRLNFKTTEPVQAAISALGRTEDVRFAPGNRLLALAGFGRKRCLILRVNVELTPGGPQVSADDYMELTSDGIGLVHGIDFIDDETLVVANRDGLVSIIQLPPGELAGRHCHVVPIREVRGSFFCRVKTPGSVAIRHEPNGLVSVLVCNNYSHRVTRHVVDPRAGYRIVKNQVLLSQSLKVPDGIAISRDGEWIAVSSHRTHDVQMFATAGKLGPGTAPAGTLGQASYPHGLRFSADDRYVLVADAGSPVIHVYDREADWNGQCAPARSVVVLDDEAFARGRTNKQEGGPKGLDIDRSNQVVATTCEQQPLAFYPLRSFTGQG